MAFKRKSPKLRPSLFTSSIFILCSFGAANLFAQPTNNIVVNIQQPYYDLDFASFAATSPDSVRLEVYLQISNSELQFIRKDDLFQAQIDISVVAAQSDANFSRVKYHNETISVRDYADTFARSVAQIVQFDFILPVGAYDLMVQVLDFHSNRIARRNAAVKLPGFGNDALSLSDIEISTAIKLIADENQPELGFFKNNREVIPRPSREFQSQEDHLGIYFEVYGLKEQSEDAASPFYFEFSILDSDNNIQIEKLTRLQKPGPSAAVSVNPEIDELASGRYVLVVSVMDPASRRQVNQSVSFFRWSDGSGGFDSIAGIPLDALTYIAEPSRITQLKSLSQGELTVAIDAFWDERDPTPETEENEAYTHFAKLVTTANQAFGSQQEPGWRSDQGRIFIWRGMPDAIYRNLGSSDSHAVEIWAYREFNEKFIFIDRTGTGNFRLLPAKEVNISENQPTHSLLQR